MVVKACKRCGSSFDARGRAAYCSPECKEETLKEQRKAALKRFNRSNPSYFKEYYEANEDQFKERNANRSKEEWNAYAKLARQSGWWNVPNRVGTEAGDVPKDEAKLLEFLRKERERLGL